MGRVYFYKLTTDNGGAPCVQDGLLSLSICKPMIRSSAEADDLIFGFAANSLRRDNCLLYIARITQKVRHGQYYVSKQFAARGDCIYERRGDRFHWRKGALHHGPNDLVHDLGEYPEYRRANVLLSTDFRYLGHNGTADYNAQFPAIKGAVEDLGRGHRIGHDELLLNELFALKEEIWRDPQLRRAGRPSSSPRRGVCHRGRSCRVLQN